MRLRGKGKRARVALRDLMEDENRLNEVAVEQLAAKRTQLQNQNIKDAIDRLRTLHAKSNDSPNEAISELLLKATPDVLAKLSQFSSNNVDTRLRFVFSQLFDDALANLMKEQDTIQSVIAVFESVFTCGSHFVHVHPSV